MNCCDENQPSTFYDELAPCQSLNYSRAAVFRFNLPASNHEEENEYIAFVMPSRVQRKNGPTRQEPPPCENYESEKDTRLKPIHSKENDSTNCQYSCWSTEYRSTIDDCAKRFMCKGTVCKREPIYPRNGFADGADEPREELYPVPSQQEYTLTPTRYRSTSQTENIFPAERRSRIQPAVQTSDEKLLRIPTTTRSMKAIKRDTIEEQITCPKPTGNRPMCRCDQDSFPQYSTRSNRPLQRCYLTNEFGVNTR